MKDEGFPRDREDGGTSRPLLGDGPGGIEAQVKEFESEVGVRGSG